MSAHNGWVDWRKPLIGTLAGLGAFGDASASTSSISGRIWLSVYVACAVAVAMLGGVIVIKKKLI